MSNLRPADWLGAQRDAATLAGRPVEAVTIPSVLPVATGAAVAYVHKRGSRHVATDMLASGNSKRIDGAHLIHLITGGDATSAEPGAVVLPDASTAATLLAAMEAESSTAARKGVRALTLCRALPSSRHVVVLTEALERKYFMPAGLDTTSIEAWRAAFGLSGMSALEADRRLYRAVISGLGGMTRGMQGLTTKERTTPTLQKAVRAELSILRGLEFTGLATECARFNQSGIVASVWSFVTSTDPLRRAASYLDGSVFQAKVVKVVGSHVYARIKPPFKAKVGRDVVALSPDLAGDDRRDPSLVLEDVAANPAGEFIAQLSVPVRSSFRTTAGEVLDLTPSPFIPSSARTARTKWTGAEAEGSQKRWRDVPLSVSLAGAPQEAGVA